MPASFTPEYKAAEAAFILRPATFGAD